MPEMNPASEDGQPHSPAAGWDRGARFTVLLAALLLVWSAASLIYLFTLPTDGWLAQSPPGINPEGLIYIQNLMAAPSDLHSGDLLIAVNGQALDQQDLLNQLSPVWRVGNTVAYTVPRDGGQRQIPVALVGWRWGAALRQIYIHSGGLIGIIAQLVFFLVAGLAFFRRPADHAARTLVLLAAAFILGRVPLDTYFSNLSAQIDPLASVNTVLLPIALFTVLFPPMLLRLGMVFPHPKPILRRRPFLEYVPFVIGAAVLPLLILTNGAAGYVWTLLAAVGALILLVHSAVTMRDALSHAQLLWGLWGTILGLGLYLISSLPDFGLVRGPLADTLTSFTDLGFGVIGVSLGIAILRYRLWDINLIIRRTLVYLPLTAILGGLYSASITLSQKLFVAATGEKSDAAVVLTTFFLVAAFTPIKNALQVMVDKRFKESTNPIKTIHALKDQVRAVVEVLDTQAVTRRLMDTAITAFGATGGAVYLDKDGEMVVTQASPQWRKESAKIDFPMEWNGQRIGQLSLMQRQAGLEYSKEERDALQEAATMVARAIYGNPVEPLADPAEESTSIDREENRRGRV